MKSRLDALFLFMLVCSAVLSGCDQPKKKHPAEVKIGRKGERLMTPALKLYDGRPSISSDGSKIGFISGRGISDAPGGEPYLRAFSSTFAIGEAPASPARITSDDLAASETDVQISPDGTYAAILAEADGQADLHLYDFNGNGRNLTQSMDLEKDAQFSADSKLLAWTAVVQDDEGDGANSSISLVSLAEPTKILSFSVDTKDAEFLFWIPMAQGYKLIFSVNGSGNSIKVMKSLSFDSASLFPTATAAAWATDTKIYGSPRAGVGRDFIALSRNVAPGEKSIPTFGDAETALTEMVNLHTEATFLDYNGLETAEIKFSTGHEFLSASLSAVVDFGVFVSRIRFHCKQDGDAAYFGTGLFLYRGTAANAESIVPISDDKSIPTAVSGSYCDRVISETAVGKVDKRIAFVQMNSAATVDKFRLMYESTESGDAEIRFIDSIGGTRSIQELSGNK